MKKYEVYVDVVDCAGVHARSLTGFDNLVNAADADAVCRDYVRHTVAALEADGYKCHVTHNKVWASWQIRVRDEYGYLEEDHYIRLDGYTPWDD